MATTPKLYFSSDNGQVVCSEHRRLYGNIPWSRLSQRAQFFLRQDLADILRSTDSLCEMCRSNARRANAVAAR